MPDGDAWAAFTAAPTSTVGPVPPVAAPASDGWEAFTAPATSPDATQPATRAPTYDEYNAAGQWIGTSDEGYQGPYAKLHVEPPAPVSGYAANVAAGGNAAIAGALGLPVDLATGGINLATRGINAAVGTNIPPITDPVGGSGTFKRAMGVIGANPDDVQAEGLGQEVARGVGGGIVSAAIPAGATSALVRGGMMTVPAAARTLSVLGDVTAPNALLGAASGGAGEAAASQAPDQWKPVAGMAGGLAAVGVPLAGAAGVRGAYRAASDHLAPMTGRVNPLLDASGSSILSGDGVPLNMLAATESGEVAPLATTRNQARIAGQRLQGLSAHPAAVRTALADQGPRAYPGNPTTAQLTRDPGLLAAERGVSRVVPGGQGQFLARAAGENDTRVGMLRGVAEGGDPAALPAALQTQAADADAAAAAHIAGMQATAAGDVAATDAAGQARVAGLTTNTEAARARLEAESQARLTALQDTTERTRAAQDAAGQARVAGLRGAAEQARGAMGGDLPAGSEGQVGAAVRAPVKAFDDAARARESAAWRAIDPDGKLAVDMSPIKEGAAAIMADRSPLAEPMAGKEAGIFETVRGLRDVHSFKDLTALRQRLTDAIRQERISPSGDAQAVRRMSMLLGHVHDAMENSLVANAAADARAVANGTLAPDQTAVAKFVSERDLWHTEETNAARSTPVSIDPGSAGRDASGRPGAVPPVGGTEDAGGEGAGNRAGARRVPPGATNEVTPLPGSNRKPESLIDFLIAKGGVRDQAGELGAMDAQLVHQRGAGRLVNPKGLSLDYAREAAAEAGFIRPNATTNDLLDAIGEHLSGNHRYRISEQAIGDQWGQAQREAISEAEARYDATDRVNAAADDAGVRLSPAEREHAADLHMQGIHPDVAVQQAASAGESVAFDRSATANAVGSPGVPLTARQADNGLTGANRLERNFDQAAADRYATARALTAERKGGFDGAPGVKSILQGGPTSGSFKLPDASVAASVIRAGPSGADHVRIYLAKGGTPEALSDAAAFSLRRDAMRPDGTLDPARTAKWAKDRSSFLSALPDAAAKFGDAAAAQRALEDATAAEVQAMKASTTADARSLKDATAAETQALKDRAAADVKTLKAATADAAQALKQATATAQRTVDEAMASQAAAVKARQNSAVGKFLGEADPVTQVASILRSPTAVADMRLLAQSVKGDADATAGLQRAVVDHILRDLKGDALGAGGTESFLHGAQLQKFLRQREPALRQVLTDQQMTTLRNVAASLERTNLSVTGSKMAGGSDSVQIAFSGASAAPTTFLGSLKHQIGTHLGTAVGGGLGYVFGDGPVGALVGGGIGRSGDFAIQAARAARQAGMRTVDDLVANAMLHPQLAAVLLAKVTDANRASLGRALVSQLRRISLVSSAVGQQDKRQPAMDGPPRNAMLH